MTPPPPSHLPGPTIRGRSRRAWKSPQTFITARRPAGRAVLVDYLHAARQTRVDEDFPFVASVLRGPRGVTNRVARGSDVNARRSARSAKAQQQENESMRSQSVKEKLTLACLFKIKRTEVRRCLSDSHGFAQSYSLSGAFTWSGQRSWRGGAEANVSAFSN